MTPAIRMQHIIDEVADSWNVGVADLIGRSQRCEHVWPRHLAMYLIRFATVLSFPQIGRRFDDRDHATVIRAVAKIEHELTHDVSLQSAIMALASRIRARADREAACYALSGDIGHG